MKNRKSNIEVYTEVNSSLLQGISRNVSTLGELVLYDNLHNPEQTPPSEFAFLSTPLKLRSNFIVVCLEGWLSFKKDFYREIKIEKGCVALFKDGPIIEFIDAKPDSKLFMISIPQGLLSESLNNPGIIGDSFIFSPDVSFIHDICTVYGLMKQKIDDLAFTLRPEIVYTYLRALEIQLAEAIGRLYKTIHSPSVGDRKVALYYKFIKEVKENFTSHRDVAFYSSALCLSPGHLSRIVKNVSGKSVSEWIKHYVILEAKVLLRSKNLAVYQISEILNFPNPSFFSKYFRETVGLSPSEYRDRL